MLIVWFDEIAGRTSMAIIHRRAWDEAKTVTKHAKNA
jgi:hypothetical protein